MKIQEIKTNKFNKHIKDAIDKLRNDDFEESYKIIINAIGINPNAPEPHNLLGIWFELNGSDDKARKHYRVAYVLDPTYKPACSNLERVSTLFLSRRIPFDFGDETDQINTNEKRVDNNVRNQK